MKSIKELLFGKPLTPEQQRKITELRDWRAKRQSELSQGYRNSQNVPYANEAMGYEQWQMNQTFNNCMMQILYSLEEHE